jgi:phosphocarrier protein
MNGPAHSNNNSSEVPPARANALVREVAIVNKKGLHARASAKFVQLAEQFDASIEVARGGETVGGTSIMGLMMLSAGPGSTITITATGTDAAAAMEALCALIAGGFGEED